MPFTNISKSSVFDDSVQKIYKHTQEQHSVTHILSPVFPSLSVLTHLLVEMSFNLIQLEKAITLQHQSLHQWKGKYSGCENKSDLSCLNLVSITKSNEIKSYATVSIMSVSHTVTKWISFGIYASARSQQVMQQAERETEAVVCALWLLLPPLVLIIVRKYKDMQYNVLLWNCL